MLNPGKDEENSSNIFNTKSGDTKNNDLSKLNSSSNLHNSPIAILSKSGGDGESTIHSPEKYMENTLNNHHPSSVIPSYILALQILENERQGLPEPEQWLQKQARARAYAVAVANVVAKKKEQMKNKKIQATNAATTAAAAASAALYYTTTTNPHEMNRSAQATPPPQPPPSSSSSRYEPLTPTTTPKITSPYTTEKLYGPGPGPGSGYGLASPYSPKMATPLRPPPLATSLSTSTSTSTSNTSSNATNLYEERLNTSAVATVTPSSLILPPPPLSSSSLRLEDIDDDDEDGLYDDYFMF